MQKFLIVVGGVVAFIVSMLGFHAMQEAPVENNADVNADGEVTLQDVSIVMSAMSTSTESE